jgi:hypothetical protein
MRGWRSTVGGPVLALAVTACGSHAPASTQNATPLGATLGWFAAINAHDRPKVDSYFTGAFGLAWTAADKRWSRFTDLHCKRLKVPSAVLPHAADVDIRCTFHESASPTEGNPDSFWDVYMQKDGRRWLVDSYGQG